MQQVAVAVAPTRQFLVVVDQAADNLELLHLMVVLAQLLILPDLVRAQQVAAAQQDITAQVVVAATRRQLAVVVVGAEPTLLAISAVAVAELVCMVRVRPGQPVHRIRPVRKAASVEAVGPKHRAVSAVHSVAVEQLALLRLVALVVPVVVVAVVVGYHTLIITQFLLGILILFKLQPVQAAHLGRSVVVALFELFGPETFDNFQ
jgi:K+-sensing histidine kinase KdpD